MVWSREEAAVVKMIMAQGFCFDRKLPTGERLVTGMQVLAEFQSQDIRSNNPQDIHRRAAAREPEIIETPAQGSHPHPLLQGIPDILDLSPAAVA